MAREHMGEVLTSLAILPCMVEPVNDGSKEGPSKALVTREERLSSTYPGAKPRIGPALSRLHEASEK